MGDDPGKPGAEDAESAEGEAQTPAAKLLRFPPQNAPVEPRFDVDWFYEDEEFFSEHMDGFDM